MPSQYTHSCSPILLPQLGPERFRSIRGDLVRKARALGADTLVTLYHSCHREWCEVEGAGDPVLRAGEKIAVIG